MDDSDQDFVDLCSKLLKRVRKKPGEPRQPRKAELQPSSQAGNGGKRKRNHKRDGDSASKCAGTQPIHAGTGAEQQGVCGGAGCGSGDAGSAERGLTAKDKVLQRMQQFKWTSPQRMVHRVKNHDSDCAPLPSLEQNQGKIVGRISPLDNRWNADVVFALCCCVLSLSHTIDLTLVESLIFNI